VALRLQRQAVLAAQSHVPWRSHVIRLAAAAAAEQRQQQILAAAAVTQLEELLQAAVLAVMVLVDKEDKHVYRLAVATVDQVVTKLLTVA